MWGTLEKFSFFFGFYNFVVTFLMILVPFHPTMPLTCRWKHFCVEGGQDFRINHTLLLGRQTSLK